jgi:transposase InsO family protein
MIARCVRELADDGVPVAVACRVLGISRSGFYEAAGRSPSPRAVADEQLSATITQIRQASRATYGAPRVHAELRLGLGIRCGRKRVARLMRHAGLVGVCHRRKRRGTGRRLHRTRTWCAATSPQRARTGCGAPTSPSIRPVTAGCTAARCWTCSPARSWAGRSRTTCDPNWWWTPWRWRGGDAVPRPARSCTRTAEVRADSTGRRNTLLFQG